ncbi:MAG TPA: TIGR03435 family protein [Bryobacteraceae bacterium]|jgi:uncharacterized protein (TIGR03435 family)|nr:TIGR03435 family protein [Bryobacteraceae bacterium]
MLQTLLTDRFQLRFHRETRTGDVYLLERSGKALGLHPAEMHSVGAEPAPRGVFGSIGYVGGRWSIYVTSMPQLAKFAADFVLQAPVIDRTGLSGLFDYRQPVADAEPNYIDNTDSFLRFLTELGIRLKRAKGAVEMLVIDSASRPSAN